METVSVQTTQNIAIDYKLAGIGHRIGGFLTDMLVIAAYMLLSNFIIYSLGIQSVAIQVANSLIAYLYFLISEISMNGQTLGKRAVHIKVIKIDGSTPSVSAYILRWIMFPIDFSIGGGVALLCIIFTKNAQRLGDIIAGTTVVRVKKSSDLLERKKASIARIDEHYQPQFPDAIKLSDDDIRLMEEALRAFSDQSQRRPMELLKEKMEEKTGVQTDMHPIKFLNTLIRDYTYFSVRR